MWRPISSAGAGCGHPLTLALLLVYIRVVNQSEQCGGGVASWFFLPLLKGLESRKGHLGPLFHLLFNLPVEEGLELHKASFSAAKTGRGFTATSILYCLPSICQYLQKLWEQKAQGWMRCQVSNMQKIKICGSTEGSVWILVRVSKRSSWLMESARMSNKSKNMASSVRVLAVQHPHKKMAMAICACQPSFGRWRWGGP